MRRGSAVDAAAPGQDSFLDVVCNLVGIMVVLVMVVAGHAKSSILASDDQAAALAPPIDVAAAEAAAQQVQNSVDELAQKIQRQQLEIAYRNAERDQIQKIVLLAEDQLTRRSEELSDEEKSRIDLAQQIAAAQDALRQTKLALSTSVAPPPNAIEHLPTPMATTVLNDEVHFRLLGGRLAYVPYNEMIARLQVEAPNRVHRLQDAPRIEESLPIVQGFGGKYILRRVEEELMTKVGPARRSSIELELIWLVDAEANLGEPFEQALLPASQFRSRLSGLNPQRTVITVWVYPDSFDDFRRLKEQLYRLGYLTAARPLPMGKAIGGSPGGSRSAAE